jgi:hypothetical protein
MRCRNLDERTILCLQAGNVNTGPSIRRRRFAPLRGRPGAWIHVDGAFGLWAAASPEYQADQGLRAGRLLGHRRRTSGPISATTAALRWCASPATAGGHVDSGLVPGAGRAPRALRLQSGAFAAGARRGTVGRLAVAGALGNGGDRGADLKPRAAVCRRAQGGRLHSLEKQPASCTTRGAWRWPPSCTAAWLCSLPPRSRYWTSCPTARMRISTT